MADVIGLASAVPSIEFGKIMYGKIHTQTVEPSIVCTIGHSNRPIDVFLALLQTNEVKHVLDVRTIPKSLHNPQFGQDSLPQSLRAANIHYTHMAGLGGLRRTKPDSPNGAWRNASFRGYADYMQTEEFAANIEIVAQLAQTERCALMCAEAVPWRCHRSLIADALIVRGFQVEDIIGPRGRSAHKLTAWSHVDGLRITYPPEEAGASES